MTTLSIENALIFDGTSAPLEERSVIVEGERIVDLATTPPRNAERRIDCRGYFLLPGLIDAHFHANSPDFNIFETDHFPPSLMAMHARKILEGTLRRGFTTVRDAAGGDIGLARAIEQGLIAGPRFFFSGKALSQTGGHGDFRPGDRIDLCGCNSYSGHTSLVVDGVDEVRKAARDQLRRGATQIKLFVSGGALSPSDPMWMPQFSDAEIRAAVEEAATRRTYVMAHSHTDASSRRCAELGVRSIEHGSLISTDETARIVRNAGAYVVPTFSVVNVALKYADTLGLSAASVEKVREVAQQMMAAAEICKRNGVSLGFGTDLYDHRFHPEQNVEFTLRGEVNKPLEVLRSATSINAEIMNMTGQIGCIAPGAYADLLLIKGSPLEDLSLMANTQNYLFVMKGGSFVFNDLD